MAAPRAKLFIKHRVHSAVIKNLSQTKPASLRSETFPAATILLQLFR